MIGDFSNSSSARFASLLLGAAFFWAWQYMFFFPSPEATSAAEINRGLVQGASVAGSLIVAWRARCDARERSGIVAGCSGGLLLATVVYAWVQGSSFAGAPELSAVLSVLIGAAMPVVAVGWGVRQCREGKRWMLLVVGSFALARPMTSVLGLFSYAQACMAAAVLLGASLVLWLLDSSRKKRGECAEGPSGDSGRFSWDAAADQWGTVPWWELTVFVLMALVGEMLMTSLGIADRSTRLSLVFAPLVSAALCAVFALAAWKLRAERVTGAYLLLLLPCFVAALLLVIAGYASVGTVILVGAAATLPVVVWALAGQALRKVPSWDSLPFAMAMALLGVLSLLGMLLRGFGATHRELFSETLPFACMALVVAIVVLLVLKGGMRPAPGGKPSGNALGLDEARRMVADDERRALGEMARQFGLTEREAEVLSWMVRGYTDPLIAEEMCLAPGTVKTHVKHIYQKTGTTGRREATDLFRSFQSR